MGAIKTAFQASRATRDDVGYRAGTGGTVTQLTSKATGVTLNKKTGQITTHNAALAAATEVSFVVTNDQASANDVVVVTHNSGGTAGAYDVAANTMADGSFNITISNVSAGPLSEALVLQFAIIEGAVA